MTLSVVTLAKGQLRSPKETLMSVEFFCTLLLGNKELHDSCSEHVQFSHHFSLGPSCMKCNLWRALFFKNTLLVKLIIVLSFFSLRFLYTISKLWDFWNISHLNDSNRLIKINSFFVNSEVRNVEIWTYFPESGKKNARLEEMGSHWQYFRHDPGITNFT